MQTRRGRGSVIKKIVLIIIFLLFSAISSAEEQKLTPEQQQRLIQQQMQLMTPMFGQMMKVMMEALVDVLATQETAYKLATYTKNYYEALINKGFSNEEALRIVMAVGFPSSPGMQK